jgi:protein gp37
MNRADWHTFQILTKRSERLVEIAPKLTWTENILMGVTVESQEYVYRINHLIKTPAKAKFLSLEPLLSSLPTLSLRKIDWVIVGGESGPRSRIINAQWIRDIKNHCIKSNVPFFFKQWGGVDKKKNGRLLDGKVWEEMPSIIHNSRNAQQLLL